MPASIRDPPQVGNESSIGVESRPRFRTGGYPTEFAIDDSVRRLSADRFGQPDVIEFGPDPRLATVSVHCTAESETMIAGEATTVEVVRLQGDGVIRQSEPRVLRTVSVQRDGVWKFERVKISSLRTR